MTEREYTIRCAGSARGDLIADVRMWSSGTITRGVSLQFEGEKGCFVVDFYDLRLVVEAANEIRTSNEYK